MTLRRDALPSNGSHEAFNIPITLTGDVNVGKTTFAKACCYKIIDGQISKPTIGMDMFSTVDVYENNEFRFLITDTAGQEQYGAPPAILYRGCKVLVFVYDITDLRTFNSIHTRVGTALEHCENPLVFVIGNKSDLVTKRQVSAKEVEQLCQKYNYIFMETSAETIYNIAAVRLAIMQHFCEKYKHFRPSRVDSKKSLARGNMLTPRTKGPTVELIVDNTGSRPPAGNTCCG